jgi:hypothetical protein
LSAAYALKARNTCDVDFGRPEVFHPFDEFHAGIPSRSAHFALRGISSPHPGRVCGLISHPPRHPVIIPSCSRSDSRHSAKIDGAKWPFSVSAGVVVSAGWKGGSVSPPMMTLPPILVTRPAGSKAGGTLPLSFPSADGHGGVPHAPGASAGRRRWRDASGVAAVTSRSNTRPVGSTTGAGRLMPVTLFSSTGQHGAWSLTLSPIIAPGSHPAVHSLGRGETAPTGARGEPVDRRRRRKGGGIHTCHCPRDAAAVTHHPNPALAERIPPLWGRSLAGGGEPLSRALAPPAFFSHCSVKSPCRNPVRAGRRAIRKSVEGFALALFPSASAPALQQWT